MVDKKKFKKVDDLQKDFKDMYDEDPKDWEISISQNIRDPNLFVSNRNGIWQIKLDSYFKPKPIGLGMKVGDSDDAADIIKRKTSPSFGFRPLNPNQLDVLRNNFLQRKPIDNVLLDVLRSTPKPTNLLDSPLTLQGPVLFSKDLSYISDKQKMLDKKLKKELLKLSTSSYNYI